MANTATLVDSQIAQPGGNMTVYEYEISIDTPNTDFTVRSAPSGTSRIWLVGALMSESAALNLIFKSYNSGTTTTNKTKTLKLSANQGVWQPIGNGYLLVTKSLDNLVINSSANITSLTLYVTEGQSFVGE